MNYGEGSPTILVLVLDATEPGIWLMMKAPGIGALTVGAGAWVGCGLRVGAMRFDGFGDSFDIVLLSGVTIFCLGVSALSSPSEIF